MALLARAIDPNVDQTVAWRESLSHSGFDAVRQAIGPDESRTHPRLALRLRRSVLLRTYGDEYHTDAFDVDRLAVQVASGAESLLFWGEEEAISAARDLFARRQEPADEVLDRLDLGTSTLLDASHEFGAGTAEMCRTGSVCRGLAATGPILWHLLGLIEGGMDEAFALHHTFLSVPRNRASDHQVAGGAAIHRLHVRELGSSFWGLAPWYVMQGGRLEVLDYRELYRRPDDLVRALGEVRRVFVATEAQGRLLSALLELNLGRFAPQIDVDFAGAGSASRWRVQGVASRSLIPYNPAFLIADHIGPFADLREAESDPVAAGAACRVGLVPLDDPGCCDAQLELERQGYRLSAIAPPKPIGNRADAVRTPLLGVWSLPMPGVPLALPYYLRRVSHSAIEEAVLTILRTACAHWSAAEGPVAGPPRGPKSAPLVATKT